MEHVRYPWMAANFPRKAAVIIDGGYWSYINYFLDVDLVKLCNDLCQPAYRLRSYFFDGKDDRRKSFHDRLQILPRFEVVLGNVVKKSITCRKCENIIAQKQQKMVDVQLAVRIVHIATTNQVDLIVLIAGDQDFIPAVEIVKNSGVLLKLVHGPQESVSTALRQLADETKEITEEFLTKYLRAQKKEEISDQVIVDTPVESSKSEIIHSEKQKEMVRIFLIRAMQLTSPKSDGRILATDLGISVSNLSSNWKKEYNVKKIENLVSIAGEDVATMIIEGEKQIIIPTKKIKFIRKIEPKIREGIEFVLETIRELIEETGEKFILNSQIGVRMTEKKPSWKSDFQVNKLKDITKHAKKRLIFQKKGSRYSIGIRE